ncbi:hypothetical protein IWW57_002965 [Coemansia sp. S610]|nr:hypothetical protein IWW57_002965 [Coemansia sp. S610]
MPALSLFQLLPLHVAELVANHVACSNRLLANGITPDSAEHKLLLLPLMWVCSNFRVVASQSFYRANTVEIKGDTYKKDAAQYWWSKRLKKFYSTNYHLVREIHILLDKKSLFAGRALRILSRAPFDGCAFPQARKIIFTFCPCLAQDGEVPEAARISANISAFVERVKQIAPMLSEVEVVGTSNPATVDSEDAHLNGFLLQVIRLVTRVVYEASELNTSLNLPEDTVSHLVHIDFGIWDSMKINYRDHEKSTTRLVRQNAATLQEQHQRLRQANAIDAALMALNKNDVAGAIQIALVIDKVYTQCLGRSSLIKQLTPRAFE